MKKLFENITDYYAVRFVEYNGHKFRIYLIRESGDPIVHIGHNGYHSLSIMTADGTFTQITDAREVGSSVSHKNCGSGYELRESFETLCEDFEEFIKKVY